MTKKTTVQELKGDEGGEWLIQTTISQYRLDLRDPDEIKVMRMPTGKARSSQGDYRVCKVHSIQEWPTVSGRIQYVAWDQNEDAFGSRSNRITSITKIEEIGVTREGIEDDEVSSEAS